MEVKDDATEGDRAQDGADLMFLIVLQGSLAPTVIICTVSPRGIQVFQVDDFAFNSANIYFLVFLDLKPGNQPHKHSARLQIDWCVRAVTAQNWAPGREHAPGRYVWAVRYSLNTEKERLSMPQG